MRKNNYLLIISFLVIIFTVPIIGILKPDNKFSMVENRELQSFPILKKNKIEDFIKELDNYFVDQFPCRDRLVNIYTKIQLIGKNIEARNVLIVDDWLFTKDYNINVNSIEELANSIEKAVNKDKDINFYYIIFPNKTAMLADLYPKYIDGSISKSNNKLLNQRLEDIEGLNIINVLDTMLNEDSLEKRKKYYYKTDFHWNGEGAFRAFELVINHIEGDEVLKEAKNRIRRIDYKNKYFKGDLERRFSGNIKNKDIPIINEVIDAKDLVYYTSIDDTKQVDRKEIIAPKINKKAVNYNDIYTYNLSCIRIINKNAITDKNALVFKDSYFNAMVDPMSTIFSELIIIDPRFYKEDYSYNEIIEKKDLDYIFFCYHQSNIDKNLVQFLQQY